MTAHLPLTKPAADKGAMLDALRALFEPGDVIELRALHKGKKRTDAGYFDADHWPQLVAHAERLNNQGAAVYVTLNPVNTQLLGRYNNRMQDYADATATDADIVTRRWLLVDIDPKRPKNTSATPAQFEAAQSTARHVYQHLAGCGWPAPIVGESGNGMHLLYPLALPNDTASRDLCKSALQGLAARFDTDMVSIDVAVFNAGRITKLYGTVANKGDHTDAAPWRLSRLVSVPERGDTVTVDQLREVAQLRADDQDDDADLHHGGNIGGFDLPAFLGRLGIAYDQDTHEGSDRYKLHHCPFNHEHGYGESAVFRRPSGALAFKCLHNTCVGNDWHKLRELVDGPRESRARPQADISGLMQGLHQHQHESGVAGRSGGAEEVEKLRGALTAIPLDAKSDKHSAATVIGMAIRHADSGIDEAIGRELCREWDARTGGASLAVFEKSDPLYCATKPLTTASVFAMARAAGWKDELPWSDPLPIPDALLPVEAFDYALLPKSLRPWVADIAERMQCPPDFVAVGAMVALSSVIGRKASIAPKRHDDWRVIPNLWGVIVGRPGVMKSPALSEVMKPVGRLVATANERHAELMRDYTIAAQLAELAEKDTKDKAQKLVKAGKYIEAKQLLSESAEQSPQSPPPLRRYKVTDSTVEALGEILIENPWGLLCYRDELHGLLRSLDKEGQEGARAFYLQAYDGNQGYTFDRIMRGRNLHIPAVCVAMLGGIQPGKLQSYIHDAVKGGAGDDGLLQRFGLLVWPDIEPTWRNVDRYPDTDAKNEAFETFQRLDALPGSIDPETGETAPTEYRFAADAQAEFDDWRHGFETALRSGEHHPAMESHLSKYRKLVPALALVCALADGEEVVSLDALLRALAWAEYLQSHAMRAYAAGTRAQTDGARALLGKIKGGKLKDGFTPRDVYNNGWALLTDKGEVQKATDLLCDLGYLRMIQHAPGAAGGRPSFSFEINPAILAGGDSA